LLGLGRLLQQVHAVRAGRLQPPLHCVGLREAPQTICVLAASGVSLRSASTITGVRVEAISCRIR
jgi:hypothetical protein